ncbi:tetratricopeptide repeat protein [Campylobacterota bacterium DY0563]
MSKYLFLIVPLLFIGCSTKLTVRSLESSNIVKENIHNIFLEQFTNDDINQTNYLENELVNARLENKKVFTIKPSFENIDGIISGEVLESSLDFYTYYDEDFTSRCARYETINGIRTCVRYKLRRIPCERKNFRVKTQVKVLNKNHEVVFSKIYTKTKFENRCYRYSSGFNTLFLYNSHYYKEEIQRVNPSLAKEIAKDVIKDIAPHYRFLNIEVIESINNDNKEIQKEFEDSINLIKEKNINSAEIKLEKLNKTLYSNSYEVLYNLGLINESNNKLHKAIYYYEQALKLGKEQKDLSLINDAINRVEKNLKNIDETKAQLDNI